MRTRGVRLGPGNNSAYSRRGGSGTSAVMYRLPSAAVSSLPNSPTIGITSAVPRTPPAAPIIITPDIAAKLFTARLYWKSMNLFFCCEKPRQ